jgi:tRNA/rRNA methyltransferase/tRNA (cytidine32/uridine32-2'-O)-methyltransferase
MVLSDFIIILCRASEPGNVGAVCRVMKNMGLSQLRLVAPEPFPEPFNEERLLARAIHADDVWRNARFFDTLAAATADCSLVVGTTRRRGKKRKNITLEPRGLVEWLASKEAQDHAAPGLTALVFGNERTGLDDEELNFCNIASHIPVSDAFPSLNLSHAVQIYAYELFLAFGETAESKSSVENRNPPNCPVKGEWVPLERASVDALTADITGTLAELGFYRNPGREEQTRFLRDLISRAGLTEREGRYLKDIFCKAARLGSK